MSRKCIKCSNGVPRFAPELVASGYSAPKDGKCPVCDTLYDRSSGKPTTEVEAEKVEKLAKIRNFIPAGWDEI